MKTVLHDSSFNAKAVETFDRLEPDDLSRFEGEGGSEAPAPGTEWMDVALEDGVWRRQRRTGDETNQEASKQREVKGQRCNRCSMTFRDRQLQKCYDQNLSEANDASDDLRQVRALIATHDVFQMFEGSHSARVHETLEHLLSAQMRPGLRRWYQRSGAETDSATVAFRDQLSQLTGERLEITAGISHNPS